MRLKNPLRKVSEYLIFVSYRRLIWNINTCDIILSSTFLCANVFSLQLDVIVYLLAKLLTPNVWFLLLPQNQFHDSLDTIECPRIKVSFSLWAVLGLRCGMQPLGCSARVSLVVTCELCCSSAYEISVPQPGIQPAWKGGSFTNKLPRKSLKVHFK